MCCRAKSTILSLYASEMQMRSFLPISAMEATVVCICLCLCLFICLCICLVCCFLETQMCSFLPISTMEATAIQSSDRLSLVCFSSTSRLESLTEKLWILITDEMTIIYSSLNLYLKFFFGQTNPDLHHLLKEPVAFCRWLLRRSWAFGKNKKCQECNYLIFSL